MCWTNTGILEFRFKNKVGENESDHNVTLGGQLTKQNGKIRAFRARCAREWGNR